MENPVENKRSYSSVHDNNAIGTGHAQSMLDSGQAWSAKTNAVDQWMQIDLGALKPVTGVVTQGRTDADQWVTGYTISTSTDGSTWTPVNSAQKFSGNTDRNTKVEHVFSSVSALYVRFNVQSWHNHISMRAGFIKSGITQNEHCVLYFPLYLRASKHARGYACARMCPPHAHGMPEASPRCACSVPAAC